MLLRQAKGSSHAFHEHAGLTRRDKENGEKMGNLYEQSGDLLTYDKIHILVHQTNCFGIMGAGIAKKIAAKYPEAERANREYSFINSPEAIFSSVLPIRCHDGKYVVNMYAQFKYGRGRRQTNYDAFEKCLGLLAVFCSEHPTLTVGFPYGIGCGLAGGDWNIVSRMIRSFAKKVPNDVFIIKLQEEQ